MTPFTRPKLRAFPLLCVAATLSACASMTYPLPKCDGYSRRPLNRSMWQWENSNFKRTHSDARSAMAARTVTAYAEEDEDPSSLALLDFAASYSPCEG
ncbi:hypothetical protein [Sinorhizobium sp. NFACC03]|uniref:hypothetical protein n=1 Tax=Sinorhizobium sp. NFACC03 TaxID=1566295 RepID=UPI0008887329|nr:hypothetical protein [Sinorhizobium sp. NFACC03]SDA87711.1 type IV secretion system protein VirB7 [Sinorhizobium sp. NFACC03]